MKQAERPIEERIDDLLSALDELHDYRLAFRRVILETVRAGYGRRDQMMSMCRHLWKPSNMPVADVLSDILVELTNEGLICRNENHYNIRYVLTEKVGRAA
ncbi:MAG TPA: hypothetical protein VN256_12880 [Pyrinomonadaceae bacterium]|nr:hypothetical protein [Pyrinomonadaceae bacterium]